jgi:hypothetical protein
MEGKGRNAARAFIGAVAARLSGTRNVFQTVPRARVMV